MDVTDKKNDSQVKHFDVLIVGAGPAGSTCALALKNSGLSVALIDKALFPRDKICGDAISAQAVRTLESIDPLYKQAFKDFPSKAKSSFARMVNHSKKEFTWQWMSDSYNCKRFDFDAFLFNLVKKYTDTNIFLNTKIQSVQITDELAYISTDSGSFCGSIIVGCDGAHSLIAKKFAPTILDRHHYSSAVRAYFSNVKGVKNDLNELFFSKICSLVFSWCSCN